jgi:ferredoxin
VDVKDKSCIDECPDCIYEGEQMLYIHPDECIECGVPANPSALQKRLRTKMTCQSRMLRSWRWLFDDRR